MTRHLSPAAQAVMDAVLNETAPLSEQRQQRIDAAAALRAAADQVVPEGPDLSPDEVRDLVIWGKWRMRTRTRDKLLAIADELEGRADA